MSVEIYLKVDGVEGASRNRNHKGWIEIVSCSWGLARVRAPTGKPPGHVTTGNEMSMTKAAGVDSADLMNLCASGTTVGSAQISIVPAVGKREVRQRHVVITLHDAAVKSIALAGSTGDAFITEKISLRFRKMSFEYFLPVNPESTIPSQEVERRRFVCDFAAQSSSCT